MIRGLLVVAFVCLQLVSVADCRGERRVHRHGLIICSIIINEITEGRVSLTRAKEISAAIANAGNKHFGRVTCGDMWLYMAIVHVESGFRNRVVNRKKACGLFQVHAPSWARKFGLSHEDLLDPDTNADAGIRVFKYYLDIYKDLVPTLSAYNSDDPGAATRYAKSVLGMKKRIKKRYTELYKSFRKFDTEAGLSFSLPQPADTYLSYLDYRRGNRYARVRVAMPL
ncbi:transglycosylase SLT domain-containing protein [Thermodesulfobacteriota bacterium]